MKYYCADHEDNPEEAYPIPGYEDDQEKAGPSRLSVAAHRGEILFAAEAAADDYHSEHDGWESTWPLTFVILDNSGQEVARCSVDREAVPQFTANILTMLPEEDKADDPDI